MSTWNDLLFLHGHIANPDLARSLAEASPAGRAPAPDAADATTDPPDTARHAIRAPRMQFPTTPRSRRPAADASTTAA